MIADDDGVRRGTAAEIAAYLGHGVTVSLVRWWARHDGLPAHRTIDEHGRPRVRYPLLEAAEIEVRKRRAGRGRKRGG